MVTAAIRPTQPQEWIASLDVLRAFALLGILVVNMMDFAYTGSLEAPAQRWPAWWDQAAVGIVFPLFAGKFNSLFSFLFGIGFFIQLDRLRVRGTAGNVIYLRRLGVLFLLGALHALFVWWGDVLHMYAILGVFLLLMRRVSNKTVWVVMILCLLYPAVLSVYQFYKSTPDDMARLQSQFVLMSATNNEVLTQGSYWEATLARVEMQRFLYSDLSYSFVGYPLFFTTILLGFWVARAGYVRDTAARRAFLKKVLIWCFAIGLACGITIAVAIRFVVPFQLSPLSVLLVSMYSFGRPPLMLSYAVILVLLFDAGRLRRFFSWLTYVGRMPLTNYLMQSVVCTLLFYGYGLGLIDQVNPAAALLLSLAIWGLQIPVSVLWLRRFRFGPMEWLWRAATYGTTTVAEKQPLAAGATT